ncbi:MAG: MFS transporter [Pseudomonadota bacterium]
MGAVIGVILLDETVVAVALPALQHDLGLSVVGGHWVINVYLLTLAGLAAAAGRLGDIVGIKRLMLLGLGLFGLASLAAGLAQDGAWIIAARGIQGIGAAFIFPISLAIVTTVFPPEKRGFAVGVYGAIGTSFLALGPLVGGALTDFLSWRWIFWINPPIVLAIGAAVLIYWRDPQRTRNGARFDSIGLATLILGMGMIVFAIMQSSDWGWTSLAVWPVLAGGCAVVALFVLHEIRSRDPLIEVDLFANATVSVCTLVLFSAQFNKATVVVFGALYLQHALGLSAFVTGLALLPAVGLQAFLAIPSGRLVDRIGTRTPTLIGMAVFGLSLLWIGIAQGWNDYVALLPGLLAWAAAMGLAYIPAARAIPNAVPIDKQGQAGGIVMSSQLLGGTVGIAVSSSLYAMGNDFGIVFLVNGALALVTLAVVWVAIRPEAAPEP